MTLFRGIAVGQKQDFESLVAFLTEKKTKLAGIVDTTFSFEEAPAAFTYLKSAQHMGKVVIKCQA